MQARRKALLIGINYRGQDAELKGCINDVMRVREYLIHQRGFSGDPRDMVILTEDAHDRAHIPTHDNMIAAMQWLVSNNGPGSSVFLHYSGHGGQVADPDGDRESGFDDTIVPLDYATTRQLDSDFLHRLLVTPLGPGVRLTAVFDCCHSGTAIELPYTYRSDADGKVSMVDSAKRAVHLATAAKNLLRGGFDMQKVNEAKQLIAGASSLWHSFSHRGENTPEGLGKEHFVENWEEGKDVWMFSGCRDDQTSADTFVDSSATGAMSWAFIGTMMENPHQTYVQVLQNTRRKLAGKYKQVPQLSCGGQYDLNVPVKF